MRRSLLLCAALAVASAGLVGCGRGGGGAGSAGAGDPIDPLVDARTVEQKVADFGIADAALIGLPDLPAGWKVAVSDEDLAADQALWDCVDPPHRDVVDNDEAEAKREVELGDNHLYSTVDVYPNEEFAAEAFSIVRQESFPECYRATLEGVLRSGLPATVTVSVQIERLPDPPLGDDAAALRLTTLLTGPGGERHSVVDVIGVRVGRAEAGLTAIGVGGPFDPALVDQLLHLTAERIPTD